MGKRRISQQRKSNIHHAKQQITRKTRGQTRQNIQRMLQYRRDIMRAGNAFDILNLLESESISEDHEQINDSEFELEEIDASDSEISLADEECLEHSDFNDINMTHLSQDDQATCFGINLENLTAIAVINDQAIFNIPDWALSLSDVDLSLRWETYSRIANWLNQERKRFLLEPSFLNLTDGEIVLSDAIPVLQEGLFQLLNLNCDKTTFSKQCSDGIILWPSRAMSIEGFWSQEAKIAWCASAAIQRQKVIGYAAKNSALGDINIQPPQLKSERHDIKQKATIGYSLGPIEFVQLLCVLTSCKWRDVINQYSNQIFFREE